MASLRQTRRFSTAAPSIASHHRDTYYDSPPRASDAPSSSNTLDPHEEAKSEKEGHFRGVRKARSHHSIKTVQFDIDCGSADTGAASPSPSLAYRPLGTGNQNERESFERVKKQGKGKRSQSARSRYRDSQEEDESLTLSGAHKQSQDSSHRVKTTRGRSRPRSPLVDEDSEDHIEESCDFNRRPHFGGPEQAPSKPQGTPRDEFGNVPFQPRLHSKLRAPRSRTASPASLSALTPQAPTPRCASPSARKQSASPLPCHSRETAYKTPDSEAISDLRLREPRSRIPKANSSHQSSPTPQPMAPRTLKDVTRSLGQTQGTYTSSSDSEPHYDDLPHAYGTSSAATASFRTHNLHSETDSSMVIDATQHQHIHMDVQQRAPHRPRYGLALTSESGHVIGERSVSATQPHSSPKRSNASLRSTRTFSPQSRTVLNSSSESLSASNVGNSHGISMRPGDMVTPTNTPRVSAVRRLGGENNATNTHPPATSLKNQPIEGPSRRQLYSRHEQVCFHVFPHSYSCRILDLGSPASIVSTSPDFNSSSYARLFTTPFTPQTARDKSSCFEDAIHLIPFRYSSLAPFQAVAPRVFSLSPF